MHNNPYRTINPQTLHSKRKFPLKNYKSYPRFIQTRSGTACQCSFLPKEQGRAPNQSVDHDLRAQGTTFIIKSMVPHVGHHKRLLNSNPGLSTNPTVVIYTSVLLEIARFLANLSSKIRGPPSPIRGPYS